MQITIEETTMETLAGVGCGAGNLGRGSYTRADGSSVQGMTAWLFPDDGDNVEVGAGSELRVGSKLWRVVRVDKTPGELGAVVLEPAEQEEEEEEAEPPLSPSALGATYEGLFRGAARLGGLAGGLGVSWGPTAPVVRALTEELTQSMGLTVTDQARELSLHTRLHERDGVHRAARLMEAHGIDEGSLRTFLVRAQAFHHEHIELAARFGADALMGFRLSLRRRVTIDTVASMLTEGGATREALDSLADVHDSLGRAGPIAFSWDVGLQGQAHQRVSFQITDPERLVALAALGLSPLRVGGRAPRWLSLVFTPGAPSSTVALHFADQSLAEALEATEALCPSEGMAERLQTLLSAHNARQIGRLVVQGGPEPAAEATCWRSE